ncbi:hypothetical protein B0186_09290 [Canicola haemoglobinophilus]|uniref:Uncharacterized protein n=1 Tax=Canicola haemoglobinophilus TaxID=733 RepID=A0A1V4AZA8_9PAST|nr:hypothetical protein [Canicola haemoglobinophilus]OOR98405.1 hypothetical protein B0186_09290 [Canicola haemoglobinophilus]STO55011.1 Uncharacterised protein [Canicola haemoglobinophilus]STO59593.1 Uncharacterised protein [Canicola haemoglobinophilus]STO69418.1 Uncharacterised protein [Canicola haemoglobinophilus]
MKLTGDINVFLNALGDYEGNKSILEAICIISSNFEVSFLSDDEINHMYYQFLTNGVDFSFNKDVNGYLLESIFFYFQSSEAYQSYLFQDSLIGGVSPSFKKNDVISSFGQPISESINWIKYNIDSKFVHFEFNEKGISQISLFIE